MRRLSQILPAFWIAAACSNGPPAADPREPPWVARVNGEAITQQEYELFLHQQDMEESLALAADSEDSRKLKRDLLERMIDTRLLVQEARRHFFTVEAKEIDREVERVLGQYPPEQVEELLRKQRLDRDGFRRQTEQLLLIRRLLEQEVIDRQAVSREEVEKYYQTRLQEFVRPEEVRVRQIVTRTEAEATALRQKILNGASFEDLARQYSLGPEGKRGGDLGFFSRGRMPPTIEQAAFEMWGGRVSAVVASPYGFHLFQLVERRPARTLSLDEARTEIQRRLLEERAKEAETLYLRTLRERSNIERDLNLLDRIH
ncbi:MAG: hypothetical protein GYA21_17420 [Myxococcales bacterium]|nr:hypothetical protein [Myxococcales bacterium]